jgi:hypothetical protein
VVRPRPPLAPASESSLRRLSRARSPERPLRAQTVLGAMLALILVAVPFYLLRKPDGTSGATEEAGPMTFGGVFQTPVDAGAPPSSVVLGPIQRVRCGASVFESNIDGTACDPLPVLEAAFRHSILGSIECAPRTGKDGSLNFVLEVDFSNDRYNVFPGRSGKWRGPQARRAAQCALKAFPPVDLHGVRHQYAYYAIAVLAEYPAPDPLTALPPLH